MTNEMKLIVALCDALGFHVETTIDHKEEFIPKGDVEFYVHPFIETRGREMKSINGEFVINERGEYTTILVEPEINYKLVKK